MAGPHHCTPVSLSVQTGGSSLRFHSQNGRGRSVRLTVDGSILVGDEDCLPKFLSQLC